MANTKASLSELENTIELYLVKKAPALPENIKEVLVKFLPWITLILFVITLPAVLAVFGLGAFFLPFSFLAGPNGGLTFFLALIFLAITEVLYAMAIPGLFNRSIGAWRLLFYADLISAIYNLIQGNFGNLIIGTLLSLYLLFQIKRYYK